MKEDDVKHTLYKQIKVYHGNIFMQNFAHKSTPHHNLLYVQYYERVARNSFKMPFTGSFIGAKIRKEKIKPLLGLILKRLFPRAI